MEKEKQNRSTSRSMITTPQECTGEHPRPVSSLLKGLIRRKNNEKPKLSNAATKNKLANQHHAQASRQASVPCQKNKAKGPQVDYQELQKPPREPQGYQRYRTSGRGTIANQWKRKNKIDPQAGRWSQHHRNALVNIRDRFRPCSRDSSGGRTTRKPI